METTQCGQLVVDATAKPVRVLFWWSGEPTRRLDDD